ncbi:DUF2787 family protein [Aeromonas allosaccharophila]|uniref:DUF2787 family protein n=1 Tax=Aeromonas allosaccharophila TaxID=656 RepID=UPI00300692C8
MTIPFAGDFALPVSQALMSILDQELVRSGMVLNGKSSLVFNFRDPDYGPVRGGFHPVEIRLLMRKDRWQFDYVTDFSYQGPEEMAELVKEIDFNFLSEEYYLLRYGQMGPESARELYTMWESNFVSYYQMGVFTVSVAA